MAWTVEHRRVADRRGLRYPSDLTDAEWALVAPLIRPAKRGGRPRTVDVREVLNAIFSVLSTGCQWAALPKDLPPKSTVWDYFSRWEWEGTIERIHHALYVAVREHAPRCVQPHHAAAVLAQINPKHPNRHRLCSLPPSQNERKGAGHSIKGGLRSTRPATTRARRWSAASAIS